MGIKRLAIFSVLLAMSQAPTAVSGQTAASHPAPPSSTSLTAGAAKSTTVSPKSDRVDNAQDYQPPHITITNPSPSPQPWSLHEQIAWGAGLVLVILGYVGIMMAVSLLKKIARQTAYAEVAAEAAATSARAALLNAEAVIHAERPWILVTVEPTRSMENGFTVMATNRGRTPARIVATEERIEIAVDEKHLSSTPEYKKKDPNAPLSPLILLPGESTAIKPFSRDDVKGLCDSEAKYKRIEAWEDKVFIYGRIYYRDMIAPADNPNRETSWCCWYIHGRQNSGLVIAGPPEYNAHT